MWSPARCWRQRGATLSSVGTSMVTFGIGSAATALAENLILRATVQAVMHGGFQGMMSEANGGKFIHGFASGSISSIVASAFHGDFNGDADGLGWANGVRSNTTAMIAFGGVSGGLGARLAGGNFWQGAITGVVVSALNHAFDHGGPGDPDPDDVKTYEIKNSDGYTAKEYDKLPFFEKMMTTDPRVIASSGGLELIGSGPAKGAKWAAKMMRKYPGSISQVKSIGGKYWKYTIEVAGENGMTIHTKYLNMQGKTMKYFHDTYNSAGKYMHRGWTEGSVKVHQWWNGVQQYGKHYFINR